jgi:hypothetical protein
MKDPFESNALASKLDQNNCRSGDDLKGAENKKDLQLLSKCETARGIVHDVHMHIHFNKNIVVFFPAPTLL